jgi:hypothetical protein
MMDRLIYLASEGIFIPLPQKLQSFVPGYSIAERVAKVGIVGASSSEELPITQLKSLRSSGALQGKGSEEEYKALVSKKVYEGLSSAELKAREKVRLFALLDGWNKSKGLVVNEQASFGDAVTAQDFLMSTGFEPLDALVGGVPRQGFISLYAKTGEGKTSLMLVLADSLKRQGAVERVVFFSYEMSTQAVLYRAKHLHHLSTEDVVVSGQTTLEQMSEFVDKDTALFIDYADLVPGTGDEYNRINNTYAELLRLSKQSACLVTASQVRKADQEITIDSGLGSGAKSHYPELILAFRKGGVSGEDLRKNQVTLAVLKNRYGVSGVQSVFDLDYGTLACSTTKATSQAGVVLEGTDLW